jgi:hypothetical protein
MSKVNLPYLGALVHLFSLDELTSTFGGNNFAQSVQGYDDMAKIVRACTGLLNTIRARVQHQDCSVTRYNTPTSTVYIELTPTRLRFKRGLEQQSMLFLLLSYHAHI